MLLRYGTAGIVKSIRRSDLHDCCAFQRNMGNIRSGVTFPEFRRKHVICVDSEQHMMCITVSP